MTTVNKSAIATFFPRMDTPLMEILVVSVLPSNTTYLVHFLVKAPISDSVIAVMGLEQLVKIVVVSVIQRQQEVKSVLFFPAKPKIQLSNQVFSKVGIKFL